MRTRRSLAASLLGSAEGGTGGGVDVGSLAVLRAHLGDHPGEHDFPLSPSFGILDPAELPLPPPQNLAWLRRTQAPLASAVDTQPESQWRPPPPAPAPMALGASESALRRLMESPTAGLTEFPEFDVGSDDNIDNGDNGDNDGNDDNGDNDDRDEECEGIQDVPSSSAAAASEDLTSPLYQPFSPGWNPAASPDAVTVPPPAAVHPQPPSSPTSITPHLPQPQPQRHSSRLASRRATARISAAIATGGMIDFTQEEARSALAPIRRSADRGGGGRGGRRAAVAAAAAAAAAAEKASAEAGEEVVRDPAPRGRRAAVAGAATAVTTARPSRRRGGPKTTGESSAMEGAASSTGRRSGGGGCRKRIKPDPEGDTVLMSVKMVKEEEEAVEAEAEEPENCCICLDVPERLELSKLDGCHHHYCFPCIEKWADRENTCPQCKKRFHKIERVHKAPPAKRRRKGEPAACGPCLGGNGGEEDFHQQAKTARVRNTKKVKNRDQRADVHHSNPLQASMEASGTMPQSIAQLIFSGIGGISGIGGGLGGNNSNRSGNGGSSSGRTAHPRTFRVGGGSAPLGRLSGGHSRSDPFPQQLPLQLRALVRNYNARMSPLDGGGGPTGVGASAPALGQQSQPIVLQFNNPIVNDMVDSPLRRSPAARRMEPPPHSQQPSLQPAGMRFRGTSAHHPLADWPRYTPSSSVSARPPTPTTDDLRAVAAVARGNNPLLMRPHTPPTAVSGMGSLSPIAAFPDSDGEGGIGGMNRSTNDIRLGYGRFVRQVQRNQQQERGVAVRRVGVSVVDRYGMGMGMGVGGVGVGDSPLPVLPVTHQSMRRTMAAQTGGLPVPTYTAAPAVLGRTAETALEIDDDSDDDVIEVIEVSGF